MDYRARAEYINHGFGDRFTKYNPDADFILDREFEEQCLPNSVKVRLEHILRIDRGAPGEFLKYSYTLVGKTAYGQLRYRPKTEGMWKKPIFVIQVDEKTGQHQEVDKIDRYEEIWEIKYSPENVKKILSLDEFNSNVGMTVQKGEYGRQYQITDQDAFINKPMSELYPKEQ